MRLPEALAGPAGGGSLRHGLGRGAGPDGFAIETGNCGELAGHSVLFDKRLIEALHAVVCLVRVVRRSN